MQRLTSRDKSETLTIPAFDECGNVLDSCLHYNPHTGRLSLEPSEELAQGPVRDFDFRPDDPEKYERLTILLNNRCNFACEYCYSAAGRTSESLTTEDVDDMLAYFIDPTRVGCRKLRFFISGGGEPLATSELLFHTVESIKARCERHSFAYQIVLITNGSLLTKEVVRRLMAAGVHVSVSFELTRTAQERHRGHYEQVRNNIKTALSEGCVPSITTTVTPETVGEMSRMCAALLSDFVGVRDWCCTPVIDPSLDPVVAARFYRTFTNAFYDCQDRLEGTGVSMGSPFYWKLTGLRRRFCGGKMCLNYRRDITICPLSSSPREPHYVRYIYGRLECGHPVFDRDRFLELMRENETRLSSPDCSACFLRYHCAGLCFTRNLLLGDRLKREICRFYRYFASRFFWRTYARGCAELSRK